MKNLITRLKTQELMERSLYYGAYYQCHYFGDKRKSKKKWQKCPTTTPPKGIGAAKKLSIHYNSHESKQLHSTKGEQAKRKKKLCHIEKFLSRRRRRTYKTSDYRQKEEDLNWNLIGRPR